MPIDKIVATADQALDGLTDGVSILVGGFGGVGSPIRLLDHVAKLGLSNLTLISNNAGSGSDALSELLATGAIAKIICSYPRSTGSVVFDQLFKERRIELELCPQGSLTERIRVGGSGIAAFFTPTGANTALSEGKEHRKFAGTDHVLEHAITADFALLRAEKADRWGNLVYRKSARNFGPSMAMAGRVTIVEVQEIVPLGALDPEAIVTPGVFVQRVVLAGRL